MSDHMSDGDENKEEYQAFLDAQAAAPVAPAVAAAVVVAVAAAHDHLFIGS
jgi:hypothetical protein